MEHYYIAGHWGARYEDIDTCAKRAVNFLSALAQVDRIFSCWAISTSASEPPPKIEVSVRAIRAAFLEEREIEEKSAAWRGEQSFPDMGYSLFLWNCELGDESLHLSVTCGDHGPLEWPNRCGIDTLSPVGGHSRVLTVKQLTRILSYMVSAWDPDLAFVSSSGYKQRHPGLPHRLEAGWLTYVPEAYRTALTDILPGDVATVDLSTGGLILTAVEEAFDVRRDEHVARVRMIQSLLDRITG
jgi:hypothetical protein